MNDFTSEGSSTNDDLPANVSLDFSESGDSHLLLLDELSHSNDSLSIESLSDSDSWSSSFSQLTNLVVELSPSDLLLLEFHLVGSEPGPVFSSGNGDPAFPDSNLL